MKIGTTDVKSKSRVVGEASFPVFESVNEALSDPTHGLGESQLLSLLNAQIRTNAMNEIRAAHSGKPSKKACREEAFNDILQEVAAGNHPEVLGNQEALNRLIDKRAAEIESRKKEALVAAGVAVDDDEDEDENE